MIRVVLDTNVLVSAMLSRRGNEAHVLRLAHLGIFQICISQPILEEYRSVLYRPEFRQSRLDLEELLAFLRGESFLVVPEFELSASIHRDDNRFMECAETANADFLVTGNKRHFPPSWKSTKIVNARELLLEIIL